MHLPDMNSARRRKETTVKYKTYNYDGPKFGEGKKCFIRTYGCQMNEHDGEKIRGIVESIGYSVCENIEDANLVILNTCAIRENAHDKVFGYLGVVKKLKETNKDLIVGICGCMSQEENVVNLIRNKYKYVDFICGTHNLDDLPNIIYNSINMDKTNIEVYSYDGDIVENIPCIRDSIYSAWVDIQYGCDKFCTYCIVPYTRGTQRSRKKEDIINEVIELKEKGYKEVTLLGQNVNAYGKDIYDNYNLANLLEETAKTNIDRVRFVTSHPWDFTDEMIDVIEKYPNVMPYVHLPIQSGSSRILKLMNRRYTKESYLELYNKIRNKIKNVSITTDIIVGFPGETEEDFNETLDIVNECKFDGAFTFAYSPRENTPAAMMKQTVSEEEKLIRLHKLNELVNKHSNESNTKMLNTIQKCLVIGLSDKNGKVCGYTENMKLVNIDAPVSTIGSIIDVEITEAKSFSLNGKIVK